MQYGLHHLLPERISADERFREIEIIIYSRVMLPVVLAAKLLVFVGWFACSNSIRFTTKSSRYYKQYIVRTKNTLFSTPSNIDSSTTATEQTFNPPEFSNRSLKSKIAEGVISSLFKVRPLFKIASKNARNMMVNRGKEIDVDWEQNFNNLNSNIVDLTNIMDNLKVRSLQYPQYYLKPFHAYDDGNLSWQAAMEVDSAALTVHAHIYTNSQKELEKDGDSKLRSNFHSNMKKIFDRNQFSPKKILDIGCSTGLSTFKFLETFPGTEVIGLDLSPYMLAVAQYKLKSDPILSQSAVSFLHAAGESSTLGQGDVDLVTISLVSHELPAAASADVFKEAYRVLPPGGAIAIMDMDPDSANFKAFASNPFALAAFKSTEPWLQEYVSMDMYNTLRSCGFTNVQMLSNSPRHRTVVAFKT